MSSTDQPAVVTFPRRRAGRLKPALGGLLLGSALLGYGASASPAQATISSRAPSGASSVPLYLLSSEGYDSAECTAFQKATGIVCKLSDNSTGPTLALIQATRNNPHWGVAWTDGNEPYAALDSAGLLLKGWEPSTGKLTARGKRLVPADKSYIPTGLTVAGAFIYNSSVVKTPPRSWQALLSPVWHGRFEMNNPAVDGPTYPLVAGLFSYLGGVSQGESFLTKLKRNGLLVSSNNAFNDVISGKVEVAIGQNTDGIGASYQNKAIKVFYPTPSAALPSTIAIDGRTSPAEIAVSKRFADFVYSPAGQQVMRSGDPQGDSNFFPIIVGTRPRPYVPAVSSIPFVFANPYVWGAREAAINTWFSSNIA